jgi:hypothetical protein
MDRCFNKNKTFSFKRMTIDELEILRINKNKNKNFFFLREDITPEQQLEWYEYMQNQKNNFMFVFFDNKNVPFGCIGYRKVDDVIDIYNVIRFVESDITMSKCMEKIIDEININYGELLKQVLVLENNPAITWYEKNGFEIVEHKNNFVKMVLKK